MQRLFGSRQKRKYEAQAAQLVKLGFTNKDESIKLLELYAGDVNLVLEEYYAINKKDAELLKEEGNAFMQQEKFEHAVQSYTKSIHLNPQSAVYYANRAAAYIQLEQHKRALTDSRISSQIDPNYVKAYIRSGLAHFKMGNFEKANDSYCKALSKIPISDTTNYAYCLQKIKLCQNACLRSPINDDSKTGQNNECKVSNEQET